MQNFAKTPDPEFDSPAVEQKEKKRKPQDHPQAQAAQRGGGGGAPGTGSEEEEPTPEEVQKIGDTESQLDEIPPPGDV